MRNIALMLALTATPRPAYAGTSFGTTGAYEFPRGRATIALDPADPRNAILADIALAPCNAQGRVEAVTDLWILRPTDPARGNGTLRGSGALAAPRMRG
jgi:hypothetical protein